ncbi:MAG: NnrS [Panacagrimonas sp.]|nr:NnrS family protein [Panacagrimonas sp.]MCC2655444.1 NnrS [Panacagrimonas sp.]
MTISKAGHADAARWPSPAPPALWQLGFRPFYLVASIFAALSIALWAAQVEGWLPYAYLRGPWWHAHEMLFGFALAVITGFLFTAGRNWTGHPTPTGRWLMGLVLLWIAARVLVLSPLAWAAAATNIAFPLAVAVSLGIPVWRARSRRNYVFVGLLVLMALAAGLFHLAHLGVVSPPPLLGLQLGLDVVLFVMAVMAGRIVPMFTHNAIPDAAPRRVAGLEVAALGAILVMAGADVLQVRGVPIAAICGAGALLHLLRWLLWRPYRTLRTPILWILHVAYAWIPLHLALRAMGELGHVASSLATHALTVGAMGGLIIGMITRTARGHTGRPLVASRGDVTCYVLVLLAAITRVGLPMWDPELMARAIWISALLWSAAFALYAITYWPVLTRPRLDGKPG